jgi:hypothetical protein
MGNNWDDGEKPTPPWVVLVVALVIVAALFVTWWMGGHG